MAERKIPAVPKFGCPNCQTPMIGHARERGTPTPLWFFQWNCVRCGATLEIEADEMRSTDG